MDPALFITHSNSQVRLEWQPFPGTDLYRLQRAPTVAGPFTEDTNAVISGFEALAGAGDPAGFFQLEAVPLDTNALQAVTLLNRLAYGPTPDELKRVRQMGADAYIAEQLAPEQIEEQLDIDAPPSYESDDWQYFTGTGTASSTNLYIYLNAPGEGYIDDLRVVAGSTPGQGVNLIRNADFESPLLPQDWNVSPNMVGSEVAAGISHSGSGSLHLKATSAGETLDSSIWQAVTGLSQGARYSLSYWYKPVTNGFSSPTVRFSGSWINSSPFPVSLGGRLQGDLAVLDDLRAWHVLRGLTSKRQLLEILDQFLENHFVTQHSKTRDYLNTFYTDDDQLNRLATRMEYVENHRWREALSNPQCTFLDLLRISAESPAMIVYLDTVTSRGDGRNVANENYARELFELFSFGVDNGYDQTDIVEMSKVWTGWRVRLFDATNEFNPFAPQSTTIVPGSTNTSITTVSNLVGVWGFAFRSDRHSLSNKFLFTGKTIPARFGPPYTTRTYGTNGSAGRYDLTIAARTGTNGIAEGYQAMAYLADLPFTQEFISVKLCRLFVHDGFEHGVYDYTDPELSAEGRLIRDCMQAWDNGSPKGQIRAVLSVIFNSELFRSHAASQQKIKTPLEFTLSSLRAFRTTKTNGTFTAGTDGYSVLMALQRMGNMRLFNRDDPDGYPEAGDGWISAGTLAERLRFAEALCIHTNQTGHGEAGLSFFDTIGLLRAELPQTDWTNATAVADCLLGLVFPAEGKANLAQYRNAAVSYLNSSENGRVASPLSGLSMNGNPSAYEIRVRGLAGMLLSSPRFQEQ